MKAIQQLNLNEIINATGKMTILGVSTISDEVATAMTFAGQNFFLMSELNSKIDQEIAKLFQAQDAHIVNSASAGIALSCAAIIYGTRVYDVNQQVPCKNEIILPKQHSINYGAPVTSIISLIGAKIKEAGSVNLCSKEDIEYQINPNTAALIYIVSHHTNQKQMVSLDEYINIAKKHQLPLIVDCAAETDIEKYIQKNLDVVIFSSSKAISGPTSGLIFGSHAILENIRKHSVIIGRTMKIGKENLLGTYVAIKNYHKEQNNINPEPYLDIIKTNQYLNSSLLQDPLRDLVRIKIEIKSKNKLNCLELTTKLKTTKPNIYLRDYNAKQNWLEIDLRSISLEQMQIINQQITKIFQEVNHE